MKKNKTENGITLIALIITIIVLLILAVVAIGIITGDGIIKHAQDAATQYREEQQEEQGRLSYYGAMIEGTAGKWIQDGTTLRKMKEDGSVTEIEIGDKVAYNELSNGEKSCEINYTQNGGGSETYNQKLKTENLEWRVLGVNEKGLLELISNKPTEATLFLRGERGYLNGENILNDTCNALYGQGMYADSSRSLKVEDINQLENYRPKDNSDYGVKWLYRFSDESEYVQSSRDGGTTWENTTSQFLKIPGEIAIDSNNPGTKEIENTGYTYKISEDTILADLIKNGEESEDNITQWLASRVIWCGNSVVNFNLRVVGTGGVYSNNLSDWNDGKVSNSLAIRPVVTIAPNVQIGNKIDEEWQLQN